MPHNAGSWYAGTEPSLRRQLEQECFLHRLGPGEIPKGEAGKERQILALLCPHAGYIYSGPVAAHAYLSLFRDHRPDVAIILGPNHTGMGSGVSIMTEGSWKTPLGNSSVDEMLAKAIQKNSSYIDIDDQAHAFEHSVELQVPFLQYLYGTSLKIVPIVTLLQELEVAIDIGEAIALSVKDKNVVIIASSDMTHYESHESAQKKDRIAIEAMTTMEEDALFNRVSELNISMCGLGPTIAAIKASKMLGATRGSMLKYATSGDITGDKKSVVGYSAMTFWRQ